MGVNGIYGLSGSGLDIESLVKVGMMSKQNEYDKMAQKYTKNEWTKTAYVELNNQINTFNMTKLFDYKLTSTMKAKTATSSDETAVTATANGNAVAMPHRVDVDSLSTNAYLISNNTLSSIITQTNHREPTENRYLKDLFFNEITNSPKVTVDYETQNLTSGATTIDYSPSNDALTGLQITRGDDGNISKLEYKKADGNLEEKTTFEVATEETTTFNFTGSTATLNLKANTSTTGSTTTYTLTVPNDSTTYTDGTKDADGKITFASKKNTDGSTSTRSLTAINGNLTITDKKEFTGGTVTSSPDTTTYTFGDTSITITQSTGDSGNTTYTVNGGGIDNETVTSSGASGAFTFTTTDGKTLKFNAGTGENDASFTIETTKSYSSDSTSSKKVETITADKLTATITTNTDSSGSITTSAKTVATESGYVGSSIYNSTETSINKNSEDFQAGKSSSIITDGNAIEFTIGDGKNTSATIGITFKELYGTWNDNTNQLEGMFTINDLVSKINEAAKAKDLNVRATYESLSDRFFLYNSESGSDDKIEITIGNSDITDNADNVVGNTGNLAKDFFNNLGLAQSKDGGLTTTGIKTTIETTGEMAGKISVAGEDGTARVDGVQYTFQDNKLNIDALGVTYTFNKTTTTGYGTDNKVDNPVTVTVGQDTDAIVSKVKSFVEDYNKILGSLYEKYDEKADSNYKPLTQSQKDSMKEEQITKWEEKAKQGLLYHDSTLSKIISDMRSAISSTVELEDGTKVSIFSLGVSTTGIKGQLTLDEDKLKKALSEDPDIVYNVFGTLNTNKGKTGSEYQGVAQRLGDIFTDATKAIKSRAGSSADIAEDSDLNNLLRELQTKMSNFKKLMSSFEDRLYKKYDAMEAALTKLGTQLSFITGGQ